MPLVVGVDEAGYGPLLGPLVVGASVWTVTPELVGTDLWQPLEGCIARKRRKGEWRLPIGDSKQIYQRSGGIGTLERGVLGLARVCGLPCDTADGLLAALGVSPTDLSGLPWYADAQLALPRDAKQAASDQLLAQVGGIMATTGVTCRSLLAEVVAEDRYNRRLMQTRNKASVLLEHVLRVIARAVAAAGRGPVCVVVDRLGGRGHYADVLMAAFPARRLRIVGESAARSVYELTDDDTTWTCEFVTGADRQHLPVALASMLAKYVRELLMARFNEYWRRRLPDLAPTAGYYTDAQRFLADIAPLLPCAEVAREEFVRAR